MTTPNLVNWAAKKTVLVLKTVGRRKSRRSSSGAGWRSSKNVNTAMRAVPPASSPRTSGEVHPQSGACMTPRISATSALTKIADPSA